MEIKTGQEQGGRTNPQQALREAESYMQGLQQNNRPFVTLADRVVRVGFNMDYANPIEISMAELQPPAPIIRTIFESINNGDADVIRTTITNQLKKIYKLSPGVQGSSEPQYLSRLFIGHSILNSVDTRGKRIDKHVFTYRKLQKTTRGTRRSHDITTSIFTERTITGSDTGDNRVLVIHFHEGGRGDVDINDPTLRVPLTGIINQVNCKEVIELYVDARSGNDGSLKFLTENNNVVIQDFTNSVNDYFQANVANHWEIHNMPDFNQASNLKKTLDATVSYQPQRGRNNKVDLGPYGDMFTNIGKNLFSVKSLITSEAYFATVLSGLLNSYSDIEFDQGDFKINVRPEFQVGGGERIDLFINVMSKNPADSDVLIGLELKYGDGRATVDSMERTLEKAEKVQLRRYGLSHNIRAITEGANFFVTLPVGFVSRAEASDSLVITRKQFVAYDIERSFLGQVHQLGRSVQRSEQTLESVTLQQNPDYRYWLSDQDIRRIAHLDNTYSNMFDVHVHAMNNNYDTSGRGLVVVTDRDQGINTGELREQIRQFIDNVDNNRIAQQQGVPRQTFIVNQGGDHWTTLVISQQNGQYNGYYEDSLGSIIPDNIRQILQQTQVTDNNIHDIRISQQADGYNCGLWALENARDINTMLQENRGVQWLRVQLAPERLSRNSEQYFRDKRQVFAQVIHDNQAQVDSSRSSNTGSTSDSQVSSSQCLNGNRKKRSISKCLYSWDDVDKFNTEQQNKRNIDEIKIDSKKFLEYTKNIQDENKNSQLLELAKERLAISDNNIVGKYKYLLNNVMQDGGYNSYIQNDRMKYLASDFSKSDARKINPKLKQRLLNAAGRIQLIRGIHSTIATCQDGSEGYCALSVSGLGYSFLSQPIESVMVKITPKIVNTAAGTAGKFIPRILGYNTKFAIQIGGMKYGAKIARGAAGVLAGAFDIVDIAISSNALVQCANRKDSNDSCSDKEIRDNIASITFSSVSFIAGVGLTVAGAPLAATGVGLVLVGGYAIYSGVSNIIEYEKKYDTTHGENWSIFWRTILFQDMAKDIQHLADRTEMVNKITKNAWKNLRVSPDDVVAYAIGFGKVKFSSKEECTTHSIQISPYCIKQQDCFKEFTKCREVLVPSLSIASSIIRMDSTDDSNTVNLSRVLPDSIEGVTMTCLPKITDEEYEKGIRRSVITAVHYCDNAVVMVHNQRKLLKNNDKWIIYDLRYTNTGAIIGSDELHNAFLLSNGNTKIFGGDSTVNKFILIKDKFSGTIYLGNSTNVLNTDQLENDVVRLKFTHVYSLIPELYSLTLNFTLTIPDNNSSIVGYFRYGNTAIHYFGRRNKVDHIACEHFLFNITYPLHMSNVVDPRIFVDSGGGYSNNKKDLIEDCSKAIVQPFTEVKGVNGIYTLYVKTEGYENQVSSSIIDVRGNGTIVFPEIALLKDCDRITYSYVNNTISFRIPLSQNGTFTLDVKNYLDRNNNTNFALIDKYGSNIIPKLDNNSTVVNRFELHARHSLNNFNIATDYYREISHTEKDYQVFGVISSVLENKGEEFYKMLIGSSGTDVINFDKQTVFVEGGEGQDVYIISNTPGESTVTINNKSEDRKFDILSVQSIDDVSLEQEGSDLSFFIEKKVNHTTEIDTIIVENYFLGNEYKHLLLVDKNRNSFIPFELSKDIILVPFYRASSGENVFTLPVSVKQAVIDNNLEDIEFYRDINNLLLLEKDIGENPHPLAVMLKDFYSNLSQWKNHKIYARNHNDDYDSYIDLLQKSREAIDYKTYKYESVVKYFVDFGKFIEIDHNQELNENGTLTSLASDKEKIGIIILKNVSPEQMRVFRNGDNLILNDRNSHRTVSINNWCISEKYRVSILEFDLGLHPIRIHKLDKDSCSLSSLINKISYATQLYKTNKEMESLINPNIEHILRCIISINSVNITEAHITLGFVSLQDQINFIQDCNFEKDTLTELKHVVKNKGVDLLSKYSSKLTSSLLLHDYGSDYIERYMIIIRSILLEIPIISRIDEIIQENNDTLNHDYQGDDVGYVSDGSESRIQHHIKHSHLEVQVAEYVEKETSYSNYLPSITKVVGGIVSVMLPIVGIVWYRHQNRPLNPEFFNHPEERARMIPLQVMTMVAGSATLLGGQNADAQQLYTECGKSEYLVDTSVEEVEADEDAAEDLVQDYLDDDYLSAEGPGLKETINDSTKHQRNHREVKIENNQEQSLFPDKNNDHAHPMSSSASRLEFWSVNLVKSTWSIVIDAVNYLSSNSFEKGAQSLSNTNDITKLGNSFKPYPSNMGNNTRSQHNSNSHEYATPPSSTKNQDVYCVPYSWDIESKKYVRDTMSCTSLSGQTKVFSNIHQSSNFVQDKDYSIGGDSYKNCRPVEFYGRPSVYCKGNHTNLIYAPNIQPRLFDSLDSNLMLGSVILHQVRKFYQWYRPTVAEETRYHLIVEITDQQLDDWNAQINKIKELLQYLKLRVSSKELQWAEYALIDHQEAISKLNSLSTASTEMIEILNENLQALLEDLAESKEESQDEVEKNINPIHHQHVKKNNSMSINNDGNNQDSDDIISTIKDNNLKMLKAYLEAGKDANTFSRGGMTLLMRAVSNNCSTDLVKLLIEYGADVNTADNDGETAINIASYNGHLELIKVLISGGAIIKDKTAKNSPFNSVAESSMPQNIKDEIIKLLSNNLSNVDSSNNELNKDHYVISNLVEQMSAMNSSNSNVGFSTAESTNIVPPYLGQNPNCYNEVKVFA
ncbi:MAG: ankyrin repeat domain-containing protein [Rickettsia sp.]|uniref:ankyrin repeat domain-containing protein n=1 Tax=Rickettsia sp. TaxID=789 RepID=UPI00397ACE81